MHYKINTQKYHWPLNKNENFLNLKNGETMNKTLLLPILFTGCAEINKLKDDLNALTNSFVVSTFYIGTEEFSDDRVDLSTIEEMQGTQAVTYLVSAEVMDGSAPSPVTSAIVDISTDNGTSASFTEDAGGLYRANEDDGLSYQDGELVTVTANDGEDHTISVVAPIAPSFDIADEHPLNTELSIDITGQDFDSALVFVAHFPSAQIVFTNKPGNFTELYDFAYPDETSTEVSVTIPADSFSEDGIYVISLGGVVAGEADDMVNVNTALSSVLATKMAFDVVCVPTCLAE